MKEAFRGPQMSKHGQRNGDIKSRLDPCWMWRKTKQRTLKGNWYNALRLCIMFFHKGCSMESSSLRGFPPLVDEIDAKSMQDQTSQDEVRKCALGADASFPFFYNFSRNTVHCLCRSLLCWRGACWWSFASLHS